VSTSANEPDLLEVRVQLDVLDRRLIGVLAERASLIEEVVRYKRDHGVPVVDRPREEVMLDRIEREAVSAGLDPRVARAVLRAIIDAFTLVEVEQLDDRAEPS
jgi:prephenate dehydrogenase